jgi:hypothetical protein
MDELDKVINELASATVSKPKQETTPAQNQTSSGSTRNLLAKFETTNATSSKPPAANAALNPVQTGGSLSSSSSSNEDFSPRARPLSTSYRTPSQGPSQIAQTQKVLVSSSNIQRTSSTSTIPTNIPTSPYGSPKLSGSNLAPMKRVSDMSSQDVDKLKMQMESCPTWVSVLICGNKIQLIRITYLLILFYV